MEAEWRRAAAYVVCRDDQGRLLLARFVQAGSPSTGHWSMPGGGMEWGESPIETAERELEEETGLTARIGPVLGVYSRWFGAAQTPRRAPGHLVGIVFGCTHVAGELRTTFDPDDTTDAAAWFTFDEIRSLPHVPLVDFVLDLLTEPT